MRICLDVKKSVIKFTVHDSKILFGLGAIKNVGVSAINAMLSVRENYLDITNFFEFCEQLDSKSVNRKVIESLIQAGALDSMDGTRAQKFEVIDKAIDFAHASQSERERGQTNIFDLGSDSEPMREYPPLPEVEELSRNELLAQEKAMLGFYISDHPLNKYRDEISGLSRKSIKELEELPDNAMIRNGGIVTTIKVTPTKHGKEMAFISLEDFTGTIEGVVFSEVYERFRHLIKEDSLIFVSGKLSRRDAGSPKIRVEQVMPIDNARKEYSRRVMIRLIAQGLEDSAVEELSKIIKNSRGPCDLVIDVQTLNKDTIRMRSGRFKIKSDEKTISSLRNLVGKDNVRIAG